MPPTTHHKPSQDEIAARAKRYYEEAGAPLGRDEEFWLRAERDLESEETQSEDFSRARDASIREASASSGEERN